MSNRTEAEVTYAAELKAAHLAQIEALTTPGLTREERVRRFADAARFDWFGRASCLQALDRGSLCAALFGEPSAAQICWRRGEAEYSLFADLPGCGCPVIEVAQGRAAFPGIPAEIPRNWSPTAEELLPFAQIQQERRLG